MLECFVFLEFAMGFDGMVAATGMIRRAGWFQCASDDESAEVEEDGLYLAGISLVLSRFCAQRQHLSRGSMLDAAFISRDLDL